MFNSIEGDDNKPAQEGNHNGNILKDGDDKASTPEALLGTGTNIEEAGPSDFNSDTNSGSDNENKEGRWSGIPEGGNGEALSANWGSDSKEEWGGISEASNDEAGTSVASMGSHSKKAGPLDSDSDTNSELGSDSRDSVSISSLHSVIIPNKHLSYNNACFSQWVAQQGLERELEFFLTQKMRKTKFDQD